MLRRVPLTRTIATLERQSWLRRTLEAEGRVLIAPAARSLAVSEMTVRRDLLELEATGVARRVRGGAVLAGPSSVADRRKQRPRAKSVISAKLLGLVPAVGAIGLDASSTLLRLASQIRDVTDLTCLTNGWETFHALQGKDGITPLLTGGQLDPQSGSLVGPLACRAARDLLLTRFFTSAAAVDPAVGPGEATLPEAEVKRTLASMAAEVVLAVDSSKLGVRGTAAGMPWDGITIMVTELDPDDRRLRPYREHVTVL